MALSVRDRIADDLLLVEEWRFEPRPHMITSAAGSTLVQELDRYLRGAVNGRSFLIAAHRGVGKTWLVNRVVEDAYRNALDEAVKQPTNFPQRPLLVKLHGQAVIAGTGRPVEASEEAAPPPLQQINVMVGGQSATSEPVASAPQDAQSTAEGALQQITFALYRALVNEIADSFTRHARKQGRYEGSHRDLLELAAHLTLDTDLAPEPSMLRGVWERLGRLDRGVLWPDPVGTRLAEGGDSDRGLREIVAIATANQAFQVCAGTVSDSRNAKGTAAREASLESAGRLDVKQVADRVFGLLAGTAVGGAIWSAGGPGWGAAAGLATALFGSAALSWSTRRSLRQERGTEYNFIIDRSLQTLDRDLPTVIRRLREVGLAPVFLIDELDKVKDATNAIETLIKRLKNLTTDYGFFCFLCERSYFDDIKQKLGDGTYPVEHTFFSHRLLLVYRPAEMARYVRQLLSGLPEDDQAAWVVTSVVLHRARLNTMDLRRELTRMCNDDEELSQSSADIVREAANLLAMAIQLAIEHVMRRPAIAVRIAEDAQFAQLAIDVLYSVSRAWESGKPELSINLPEVANDIAQRRQAASLQTGTSMTAASFDTADIAQLTGDLRDLAYLLTNFNAISASIYGEPGLLTPPATPGTNAASEQLKLQTLLTLFSGIPGTGLLRLKTGSTDTFEFLFDRYAQPYPDRSRYQAMRRALAVFDALAVALERFT